MRTNPRNSINNGDKKSGISMSIYRGFSLPGSLDLEIVEYVLPVVSPQTPKISLSYGVHETEFGSLLILSTNNTLAGLYFCDRISLDNIRDLVAPNFKSLDLIFDPSKTESLLEKILANRPVPITLIGSLFEISVWKMLLQIPKGYVTSYQEIAMAIGKPKAVRAVASAIGRNPISLVVPCHRVIRSNGNMGGYRFGLNKKLELLQKEVLYKQHNFKTYLKLKDMDIQMIKKTLLTSSLFLALNTMADSPAIVEKAPLTATESQNAEFIDEDPEDHEPVCLFAPCNTPSGFFFTANVGMTSFNQKAEFQYGGEAGHPLSMYNIGLKSKEASFIGVGFGYLWDINKFATTIEYSFQIDTLKAKYLAYPTPYPFTLGDASDHVFSKKSSHNLSWTIGYRIFNAYTPYVGVGMSRAQFGYYYNHLSGPNTVTQKVQKYIWGNVFLAGLRVALTDHVHLKIEYQLQNFPKWNTGEINPKWTAARPINVVQLKPKFQTLLFGVSYKF